MSRKKHKVIVDVNPHSSTGGARARYYSPARRSIRSIPRRAAKPFFAGSADAVRSYFTKIDYYDYDDTYANVASVGGWTFLVAFFSPLPCGLIGNILGDLSMHTFLTGVALVVAAVYLVGYVVSCVIVASESAADVTVPFKPGTGAVSGEIVLQELTKSYESQIATLCEQLVKLQSSPDVGVGVYERAKSSVQDSLTTLAKMAEQDTVDLWNGGNMSPESQSVVDTIDAVNSALKDVKDSRR